MLLFQALVAGVTAACIVLAVPATRRELANTRPRPPLIPSALREPAPRGGLWLPARPLRHTTTAGKRITPKRLIVGADHRTWDQPYWYRRPHDTTSRLHPDLAWIWEGWSADDPYRRRWPAVRAAGPQALNHVRAA